MVELCVVPHTHPIAVWLHCHFSDSIYPSIPPPLWAGTPPNFWFFLLSCPVVPVHTQQTKISTLSITELCSDLAAVVAGDWLLLHACILSFDEDHPWGCHLIVPGVEMFGRTARCTTHTHTHTPYRKLDCSLL